MARRGKHQILVHDTEVEKLYAKAVSGAITQGGEHVTLNVSGTGVYEFTLVNPRRRILSAVVTPLTASTRYHIAAVDGLATSNNVDVRTFGYDNTTPTAADFFIEITTSKSQYDR